MYVDAENVFLRNRAQSSILQNPDFCPLTVAFDLFNLYRCVLENSEVVRGEERSDKRTVGRT